MDKVVLELEKELRKFLLGENNRSWLKVDDYMEVYVRKSQRLTNSGRMISCLDLANISISEEHRRKGLCKAVLSLFERVNPYDAVFLENVLNPQLFEHVIKREGWTLARESSCFLYEK